jgi:hypothetical protein
MHAIAGFITFGSIPDFVSCCVGCPVFSVFLLLLAFLLLWAVKLLLSSMLLLFAALSCDTAIAVSLLFWHSCCCRPPLVLMSHCSWSPWYCWVNNVDVPGNSIVGIPAEAFVPAIVGVSAGRSEARNVDVDVIYQYFGSRTRNFYLNVHSDLTCTLIADL